MESGSIFVCVFLALSFASMLMIVGWMCYDLYTGRRTRVGRDVGRHFLPGQRTDTGSLQHRGTQTHDHFQQLPTNRTTVWNSDHALQHENDATRVYEAKIDSLL